MHARQARSTTEPQPWLIGEYIYGFNSIEKGFISKMQHILIDSGIALNGHEIHISDKYMKRFSILLVAKEMQITPTMP